MRHVPIGSDEGVVTPTSVIGTFAKFALTNAVLR